MFADVDLPVLRKYSHRLRMRINGLNKLDSLSDKKIENCFHVQNKSSICAIDAQQAKQRHIDFLKKQSLQVAIQKERNKSLSQLHRQNSIKVQQSKKSISQALKKIKQQGKAHIIEVSNLEREVKQLKRRKVVQLQRKGNEKKSLFWQQKLQKIREGKQSDVREGEKEAKQLRRKIRRMQQVEEVLCQRLNSKCSVLSKLRDI